ncbi:Glycine betaine-binding protein precursor [Listeria grayi]|uniref:Betaine ABC transporter permease and substrate binding protein n=1 Tax=Listeria grayi FSL F6-1183 TaxID=1265827 RepID=A0A829R9G2_LISGR|nr:glycine betaine ABC transporter substrate-binding protein [Listeria grayi]EUJ29985.1 betaine ABC transporter permease and substrate binding protein [Listeria grayi FSL F6-1183]VEI34035.1 Glycine betaine-binding protein precursor [Listeria grayi]
MKKIKLAVSLVAALVLVLAGCGAGGASSNKNKKIDLSYVEWDTEVASTHVIGKVLEDQGYKVTYTPLDNSVMWQSVANKESDAMVAAWLPNTHAAQYKKYKSKVDDLGVNLKGAKIGLTVPAYMNVDSIEDLKNQANKKITGIEPGAGVVSAAEKATKDYSNLKGWEVDTSSSGAMTVSLAKALKNKQDIVITGWSPHWMFAKYKLKYLEDPKKSFGDAESIHTMARQGLKKDDPKAYKILDKFNWSKQDIEDVMLEINDGKDPKDAAADWVKKHKKEVSEWTK